MRDENKPPTELVYCLTVDIVGSTDFVVNQCSTNERNCFFIGLSKIIEPFLKDVELENCSYVKFTGDGWIICIIDANKFINLTCLAVILKHKFNTKLVDLTEMNFKKPFILRFGISRGDDVKVTTNGQVDFVGDSIRKANRISNLCQNNEILCDSEIYSVFQRDFIYEEINLEIRLQANKEKKFEKDIKGIYNIIKPKNENYLKSPFIIKILKEIGLETDYQNININIANILNEHTFNDINNNLALDIASFYLALTGSSQDSNNIQQKLNKVGYQRPIENWNKKIDLIDNFDDAYKVFVDMKESNINPNILTYKLLLYKAIGHEIIKKLINDMRSFGIEPNDSIYNILINKVVIYNDVKKYFHKSLLFNAPMTKLRWQSYPEANTCSKIDETCIILTGDENSTSRGGVFCNFQELEKNDWYIISCLVKSDYGTNAKFRLWCHDDLDGKNSNPNHVFTAESTPMHDGEIYFQFFKANNNSTIRIHLDYIPGNGRIEVSDVKIEKLIL